MAKVKKTNRMQKVIVFKSNEEELYKLAQSKGDEFSSWVKAKLADELFVAQMPNIEAANVEKQSEYESAGFIVWDFPAER